MDRQNNDNPENVQVRPKFVPFRCVVCNGFGTVKFGSKICQGCGGKGYVLVPNSEEGDGDGK